MTGRSQPCRVGRHSGGRRDGTLDRRGRPTTAMLPAAAASSAGLRIAHSQQQSTAGRMLKILYNILSLPPVAAPNRSYN